MIYKPHLVFIYDDPWEPTAIEYVAVRMGEYHCKLFKFVEKENDYYHRLPLSTEKELDYLLNSESVVYEKKNLYKVYPDREFSNLKDYNTLHWIHTKADNIVYSNDRFISPTLWSQFASRLPLVEYTEYSSNIDTLIKASAILDGTNYLKDGTEQRVWFDHYTKTGRLHDIGSNSIAMPSQEKTSIQRSGVLVDVDVDGYHVRILDKLFFNDIPDDVRAFKWLKNNSSFDGTVADFKQNFYQSIYSETFRLTSSEMVRKLSNVWKNVPPPFEIDHNNFNYKLQQYEVLGISQLIVAIPREFYNRINYYTFDGLVIDVKSKYFSEFIAFLKTFTYPLKVNIYLKNLIKSLYVF